MMDVALISDFTALMVSVFFIWFGLFVLYQDYNVDSFRQKMFALRDELFLDAAEGLVEFDHPAYVTLRNTMNGLLRFSHRLGLFQILPIIYAARAINKKDREILSFNKKWELASSGLSKDELERLNTYRMKMGRMLLAQILLGSPLLLLFIVLPLVMTIVPVLLLFAMKDKVCLWLGDTFSEPLNDLESTAMAYGKVQ